MAPTGSGKTCIAASIVRHANSNGHRVLFLAHRRELVWQCSEKLYGLGIEHGIIMADEPHDPTRLTQVSSLQSLHSRAIKRKKLKLPPADLVIFDEVHHLFSAASWQNVLEEYPNALILGLTATPINRLGTGMQHCADVMVKCPSIQDMTKEGFLVPVRYFAPSIPDLKGIHVRMGDYVEKELEERMDQAKLIGDVCENWSRICPDRQTLVFACGIKHSIHMRDGFRSIGIKAEHVDGNTPKQERDEIVGRFKRGDVQVLLNCQVFTEGADFPEASALVFARPTRSLLMYLQVAGRVLRPAPGKKDCVIIDHAGVIYEHGPVAQDWDWQLDYGNEKTIYDKMGPIVKEKKKRQITCDKCKHVYEGVLICPECGNVPTVKGKPVATYEGYLQEIDQIDAPKVADKMTWYLMLLGYARSKGKKDGFAYFKFIEKFNCKPAWDWKNIAPIEPSLEVKSWIRSRQIAWAAVQKKKGLDNAPKTGIITP